MSRWIVLAIPVNGVSDAKRDARTVTELEGSCEEAVSALALAVNTFEGGLSKVRRREVFRCSDRSYFVRLQGRVATCGFLIQLGELVSNSAPPADAQPLPWSGYGPWAGR